MWETDKLVENDEIANCVTSWTESDCNNQVKNQKKSKKLNFEPKVFQLNASKIWFFGVMLTVGLR